MTSDLVLLHEMAFSPWFAKKSHFDPEGHVLGVTLPTEPFLTVEIDLDLADEAKQTYPRYVPD